MAEATVWADKVSDLTAGGSLLLLAVGGLFMAIAGLNAGSTTGEPGSVKAGIALWMMLTIFGWTLAVGILP